MIAAPSLSYRAIRDSIPDAIGSGETKWIISIAATCGGMSWNLVLSTILAPHVNRERTFCFEEIGKEGDRVFVLIGLVRKAPS